MSMHFQVYAFLGLYKEKASQPIKTLTFANVATDAEADAGGSTIALPGLCPGQLKMKVLIAEIWASNGKIYTLDGTIARSRE